MSYFDDASLVMIPSGYKTSKVYSVKPTSGDGDLTFTRSNDTATRVGPDGLIEKVRTNLALYGEDLTNAAWTKNRSSITANALANPVNGATTADYIVEDTANGTHEAIQTFIVTSGVSYTVSVYAKADTRTKIALVLAGSAFASGGNGQAIFNLSTGAVISAINGATARISSAGNGWYRCSITKASIDTAGVIALELVDASDNTSYTGDGTSRAAFFGAQLEVSDFGATPYIATTSAAVSVGPVANVPRLDYLNSSCPRLNLEPQRTNLFTYSEQLNTGTSGATATPNQAVSPDGYTNADLITGAGANNYIAKGISGAFSGTHTFSIFLKAGTDSAVGLDIYDGSYYNATYNLATGVASGTGASMVSYGNGWYRCILTRTTSANPVEVSVSSIGDGLTIYAWGGQFETNASYATSYIPTLGAAVTRGADACSKTGISSLIGQTEGTLFVEVSFKTNDAGTYLAIEDWANLELVRLYSDAGPLNAQIYNSANVFLAQTSYNAVVGQSYKMALAYSASGAAFYVNGVLVSQTTSAVSVPTCSNVRLAAFTSGQEMNADIKQALLFKTRLSNADLAALTA